MNAFRAADVAQMTAVPAVSCDEVAVDLPEPPAAAPAQNDAIVPDKSVHLPTFLIDLLKVPIA